MSNFHVSYKFQNLMKSILMNYPKNIEDLLLFLNCCVFYEFHQKDSFEWEAFTCKWYHHISCAKSMEDITWDSQDQKHFNILKEKLVSEYHLLQGVIHYPYENK